MARKSRMSIVKRQRELKKSEKAAAKRAKRHGLQIPGLVEPRPTVGAGAATDDDDDELDDELEEGAMPEDRVQEVE